MRANPLRSGDAKPTGLFNEAAGLLNILYSYNSTAFMYLRLKKQKLKRSSDKWNYIFLQKIYQGVIN